MLFVLRGDLEDIFAFAVCGLCAVCVLRMLRAYRAVYGGVLRICGAGPRGVSFPHGERHPA